MIIYAGLVLDGWTFTTHKPGSKHIPSSPDGDVTLTEWTAGEISATSTAVDVSDPVFEVDGITVPSTIAYSDQYRLVAAYAVNGIDVFDDLINELCSSSEGGESAVSVTEPITVAQLKAHLRIAHSTDDVFLAEKITAARVKVEQLCARACITATKTRTLDSFPADREGIIYPPIRPLLTVTSITYYDTTDTEQTFSSDNYQVDITQEPGRIVPVYGQYWPDTYERLGAVTITYTAGYGATSATVPWTLKQGILYYAADLFRNRENLAIGVSGVHDVPHTAMHYLADHLDRRIA